MYVGHFKKSIRGYPIAAYAFSFRPVHASIRCYIGYIYVLSLCCPPSKCNSTEELAHHLCCCFLFHKEAPSRKLPSSMTSSSSSYSWLLCVFFLNLCNLIFFFSNLFSNTSNHSTKKKEVDPILETVFLFSRPRQLFSEWTIIPSLSLTLYYLPFFLF